MTSPIESALRAASAENGNPVSIECVGGIVASFLTNLREYVDGGHVDLGDCQVYTCEWDELSDIIRDNSELMQRDAP